MTLPETKMRVGLAYREAVLLALAVSEARINGRIRFIEELSRLYTVFKQYIAFPEKNMDHYGLMLRKLIKSQAIYYDQNRPLLTATGHMLVEQVLQLQDIEFNQKWKTYLEFVNRD